MILEALGITTLWMCLIWGYHLKIKNAGIVDIAWSFGFTLLILFYQFNVPGYLPRQILISTMGIFWSCRLSTHIAKRVWKTHPQEDSRYLKLRQSWSQDYRFKSFLFFQFQSIFLWILSFPFLFILKNGSPRIHFLEWVGLFLWGISLLGESVADHQLNQFKADPKNKGQICCKGLWAYSRHPNYFFEWLIWVAYFIFASATTHGWWMLYAPTLMLLLLLKVTGIPPLEELAIQRKGDLYRDYQKTTSRFVPWFRKK